MILITNSSSIQYLSGITENCKDLLMQVTEVTCLVRTEIMVPLSFNSIVEDTYLVSSSLMESTQKFLGCINIILPLIKNQSCLVETKAVSDKLLKTIFDLKANLEKLPLGDSKIILQINEVESLIKNILLQFFTGCSKDDIKKIGDIAIVIENSFKHLRLSNNNASEIDFNQLLDQYGRKINLLTDQFKELDAKHKDAIYENYIKELKNVADVLFTFTLHTTQIAKLIEDDVLNKKPNKLRLEDFKSDIEYVEKTAPLLDGNKKFLFEEMKVFFDLSFWIFNEQILQLHEGNKSMEIVESANELKISFEKISVSLKSGLKDIKNANFKTETKKLLKIAENLIRLKNDYLRRQSLNSDNGILGVNDKLLACVLVLVNGLSDYQLITDNDIIKKQYSVFLNLNKKVNELIIKLKNQ